ncbi:MAG TPA: 16S rRNA (guanine(966)-N(2))-methyltransferase RsmD [Planctomycetota bacterium]|nr:16S rRNA (guanine(966)-N(2))-methyltransferase RsmD [Planctomycetota bacterium]
MRRRTAPIIVAGTLRGRRLAVPEGLVTRPVRSRVRESIFGMLGDRVRGARVVDLYAGSGALGLEALSRGAAHCTFVENERAALAALRSNLLACGVGHDRAAVLVQDVRAWCPEPGVRFDLVLADPPFALLDPLPRGLAAPGALAPEGLVVIECPAERLGPLRAPGLSLLRRRVYGRSAVCVYVPRESTPNA